LEHAVLLQDEASFPILTLVDSDSDLLELICAHLGAKFVGSNLQIFHGKHVVLSALNLRKLDPVEHVGEHILILEHCQ